MILTIIKVIVVVSLAAMAFLQVRYGYFGNLLRALSGADRRIALMLLVPSVAVVLLGGYWIVQDVVGLVQRADFGLSPRAPGVAVAMTVTPAPTPTPLLIMTPAAVQPTANINLGWGPAVVKENVWREQPKGGPWALIDFISRWMWFFVILTIGYLLLRFLRGTALGGFLSEALRTGTHVLRQIRGGGPPPAGGP